MFKSQEGKDLDMSVDDGEILIQPLRRNYEYALDELLAGITPDNRHPEIESGEPPFIPSPPAVGI